MKSIIFPLHLDLWSGRLIEPYLSLTVHFIAPVFTIKIWCLQTAFFPEDQTGVALAQGLKDGLSSWSQIFFFFTFVKIISLPIIKLLLCFCQSNVFLFCFVKVHQCNKHFGKNIVPENNDLSWITFYRQNRFIPIWCECNQQIYLFIYLFVKYGCKLIKKRQWCARGQN